MSVGKLKLMLPNSINEIISDTIKVFDDFNIKILNESSLRKSVIDLLVEKAVFGTDDEKKHSRWLIWEAALTLNIYSSSIYALYTARGKEEIPLNFTTPAFNFRGMTYDTVRALFKTAKEQNVGAFICEIARSEMGYTNQSPEEYVSVILAAAIKESWSGPVFIQGDHFQAKAISPGVPKEGEIDILKKLITEAIEAGFYNIDIDTSTLVNLEKSTVVEQQESNIKYTLELLHQVRASQPKNLIISVGGEIGHIGGVNSTVQDFKVYMNGLLAGLNNKETGISKVSIQTGTSHGGVILPNGRLANVDIDFSILGKISSYGRKVYKIAGAVQHGASTLADEHFAHFPATQAIEIHLATGFQNLIYDHPHFPKDLLEKIYTWLDETKLDEKKANWSDDQFHYKLRKKGWGRFKHDLWHIDSEAKKAIFTTLEERFEFLFKSLNVINTKELVDRFCTQKAPSKKVNDFGKPTISSVIIEGLSD